VKKRMKKLWQLVAMAVREQDHKKFHERVLEIDILLALKRAQLVVPAKLIDSK
jgi:hypothetical protein